MQLNAAQQQAVDCCRGPCLVLAGAGSGKTGVITAKIVSLIQERHLDPARICAVTFTNKAAAEMRERVKNRLGISAQAVTISTFHSLGLSILLKEYRFAGLQGNFTLIDEADSRDLLRFVLQENHPELLEERGTGVAIEECQEHISTWKNALIAPDELEGQGEFREVYADYTAYLRACNLVDFDDLIYLTTRLLQRYEEPRVRWQGSFDYLLIDEYQDTNPTQYQLFMLLCATHRNFTVVGDDDQCIYSWRGARRENLKLLSEDFPDLKVIMLEQNYRSTQRVLDCANALIAGNDHIYEKKLFTANAQGEEVDIYKLASPQDESEHIAALITQLHIDEKRPYRDFAVLYRSNFQALSIQKELNLADIPCQVTGSTDFFALPEVLDIKAWCSFLCNPQDNMALLRIINKPLRGIGLQTIAAYAKASTLNGRSIFDNMLDSDINRKLQPPQMKSVAQLLSLVTALRQRLNAHEDLYLTEQLLSESGYDRYLRALPLTERQIDFKFKNARKFMRWMSDLVAGRHGTHRHSFAEALNRLSLRERLSRDDEDGTPDAVQLLTLHSAKGLEFPVVLLAGCNEGLLPHESSFEVEDGVQEERRLAYVGMTRAREKLILLYSAPSMDKRGKIINLQSRFLDELPQEGVRRFDPGQYPPRQSGHFEADLNRAEDALLEMLRQTGATTTT
ncbi:MAG: UvrD-helicase domain-containing protein [Succinivibrio sp.]|nr:UvrD-helicase domain-containing protein [Succinivibrio sp.]